MNELKLIKRVNVSDDGDNSNAEEKKRQK